jgi:hypothetical protein
MNENYKDLLEADAALNARGRELIRKNLSIDAVARELLPLTARYFEVLSEISWHGYLIESVEFSPPLFQEQRDDADRSPQPHSCLACS